MATVAGDTKRFRSFKKFSVILLALVSFFGATDPIVNKANKKTTLTLQELSDLFLGQSTYWDNGARVILVIPPMNSPQGKALLSELNVPIYVFKRRLARISEKSVGESPIYVNNEYKLIQAVGAIPESLSFLEGGAVILASDNIKVLKVVK